MFRLSDRTTISLPIVVLVAKPSEIKICANETSIFGGKAFSEPGSHLDT